MSDKQTVNQLSKLRVDCMYGKKKHYNAQTRYSKYHRNIGLAIVIITAFMGTSIFYTLSSDSLLFARIVTGFFVVFDAVLAGIQTFFNFSERAASHKFTADKYLILMKKAQRGLAYYADNVWNLDKVVEEIEAISNDMKSIQSNELPTSKKDYEKSQEGIEDGEETYTDSEMK